ncbi:hypothetical protein E2C01_068701 [Portunus trituberculatus]|uniref:Uncharacterized protein n=1 Tax=Portunus trituberculatus TaxID=210409 RepID=A0A5B7HWL7_PORTR|nr:hypothetical protein [Portunus trituberculatus]
MHNEAISCSDTDAVGLAKVMKRRKLADEELCLINGTHQYTRRRRLLCLLNVTSRGLKIRLPPHMDVIGHLLYIKPQPRETADGHEEQVGVALLRCADQRRLE